MSHFSLVPPEPEPEDPRDSHVDQFQRLIEEDRIALSSDVERLVDTLAANGGGDLSSDLALDILLNGTVEQARLATGASGAAIALLKDYEMVCRATSGPTAPDLGVRLDTSSGLSGACIATGLVQLCGDTQLDPRVDALASRQLGVRSILVFPLLDGGEIIGVFEIFSPRPQAFGERDIHTLEALARRILNDRQRAASHFAVPDGAVEQSTGARAENSAPVSDLPFERADQRTESEPTATVVELTPTKTSVRPYGKLDITTAILASLVIAAGVGLGLLIGWRSGAMSGLTSLKKPSTPAVTASVQQVKVPNSSPVASPPAQSQPVRTPRTPSHDDVVSRPSKPAVGGLVVFENGKEVFRMLPAGAEHRLSPTEGDSSIKTVTLGADEAKARLIYRVEPEYPPGADPISAQEPVVLDVMVGLDGVVESVTVASGDPVLGNAALSAVRQWHYQPLVVNGRNTAFRTRLSLNMAPPAQ